jgi:hypothetical protein
MISEYGLRIAEGGLRKIPKSEIHNLKSRGKFTKIDLAFLLKLRFFR